MALLTQHGKERVIASVLEPGLGCAIELVTGFDTNQLGTFTRETPRHGTQVEAARRKASKGMELACARQGIATEGSFGPDPYTGMLPWNVELLVWLDDPVGIEVIGARHSAGLLRWLKSAVLTGAARKLCRPNRYPICGSGQPLEEKATLAREFENEKEDCRIEEALYGSLARSASCEVYGIVRSISEGPL